MKASAALAEWLTDPVAQKTSLQSVDAFAAAVARRPLMLDLKRRLNALDPLTEDGVLDAARRFLDREAEIEELLQETIAAAAANPYFRPPFPRVTSDLNAGLLLFDDPRLLITLNVVSAQAIAESKIGGGNSSINFTGFLTLFKFIKGGGAALSWWEAPRVESGFSGVNSGQCRPAGERRIADGDIICLDGRCESFVVEHVEADLVHLQVLVRTGAAPLALEYDARTLNFIGASSTDEASSRVQMMVSLLRMMDRTDAVPLFVKALESEHFFTRWHIMREFLALDAEAALPHLRAMAESDPHIEIRAAARQTLAAFFEGEEELQDILCPA